MINVSINCGFCRRSKGCEIKKDIRSFFSKYEVEYEKFKLKCPLYEIEYQESDKVIISVGFGAHKVLKEVDCYFEDYHDCDNCKFSEKCNDGIIQFRNKRYEGYVKFSGKVISAYSNTKYVVKVLRSDFESFDKFNRYDKIVYNVISRNAFDHHDHDFIGNQNNPDYIYFFTNRRNLKKEGE